MSTVRLQSKTERCAMLREIEALREHACDACIYTRSKTFDVQRLVVAASSPFFKAALFSSFKEGEGAYCSLDVDDQIFQNVLDYIYTGQCEVAADRVSELLQCAHMCRFADLQGAIEQYLCESVAKRNAVVAIAMLELIDFVVYAGTYDLIELEKVVSGMIGSRIAELFSTVSHDETCLCKLTLDQMSDILKRPDQLDCSESLLFYIAKAWIENNPMGKDLGEDPMAEELLSHIRFVWIPKTKRQKILAEEPLLARHGALISRSFQDAFDEGAAGLGFRGKEFDVNRAKPGDFVTVVNNFAVLKAACRKSNYGWSDSMVDLVGDTVKISTITISAANSRVTVMCNKTGMTYTIPCSVMMQDC